jgi:hypothetical protein
MKIKVAALTALGAALLAGGATFVFAGAPAAAPPVPRTADGRVDFTGVYVNTPGGSAALDLDGPGGEVIGRNWASRDASFENFQSDNALNRLSDRNVPIYKPEHWETVRYNDYWGNWLEPGYYCLPIGVPALGAPSQIVQTKDLIILLYQGGFFGRNSVRVVPFTDTHHPVRAAAESFLGSPIAKWDGDALVVETIGFTDASWLHKNGYPHGFNMKVTERFTRTATGFRWEATVEDPEFLQEPWKMNPVTRNLNPDPKAYLAEDLPCTPDFLLSGEESKILSRTRSG